jgi:PAS domain S-box-containing protein
MLDELRLVRNAAGDPLEMIGCWTDITQQKQTEEACLASEKKYREILEVSPIPMLLIDERQSFSFINPAFTMTFGYALEDIPTLSHWWVQAYPETAYRKWVADTWQARIENAKQTGTSFSPMEAIVRCKDGTQKVVMSQIASFSTLFAGNHLIVLYDITAQKKTGEALRENEARLRAITDSAQDAIIMMDSNGLISFWNPSAERILGYTSAEAIGHNLHRFIAPSHYHEQHQAVYPMFQKTGLGVAVGKTHDLEARRKDGTVIAVQISISAVQMRDGWHAVGILRDITDRKRAESELQETNRRLEEATVQANRMAEKAEKANAAKSEFLANMSHEIRTPMNGVIGMTGLLLDTELNDEQRQYAEIVRSCGESLLGLINDILDFSKIEAKKLDIEMLDFDLSTMLDDFSATLAVQTHNKKLELLCAADMDVPIKLQGDPGRLRQILTNLAGNAVKFTHHGEIAIRVQLIEYNDDNVLLRFSVQDTGIGIPENKLGMIFDYFSQVDASTTRQYGGTGLGLAISKRLAELMGGQMGVESQAGNGSKFWFTARLGKQPDDPHSVLSLTLADRSTEYPQSIVTRHSYRDIRKRFAGNKSRILLAEDNITNQQVALGILKKLGLRADAVANGAEVLKALETLPYDLILMDVQMPEMDGLEATKRIRNYELEITNQAQTGDPPSPFVIHNSSFVIPIIAMTAHAIVGDREKCLEAGMNDYISKPVSPEDLAQRLEKWLPKAHNECRVMGLIPNNQKPEKMLTVQEDDLPVWDRQKLLARLMDDEDLAIAIQDSFLEDIPQQIQKLKTFLEIGDVSEIMRQAHTIKGAAANIGGERLRFVAYEMEKAAGSQDLAAVGSFMEELGVQFDRLKETMRMGNNHNSSQNIPR